MDSSQTLQLLQEALSKADSGILAKAGWSQPGSAISGIQAYDLETPAKSLFPVITPLRNALPRVSGAGGIQANWRAVTAINVNNLSAGVSEGNRGGVVTTTTADYLAAYKGIGLEDYVTFEADYASQGFDDLKARATQNLLRSLMIQEERIILGGNNSLALGTTPTPTLSNATTGGSILHGLTASVVCIALTLDGYMNHQATTPTIGIVQKVTRNNPDSSSDVINNGVAQKSANATVATDVALDTNAISASVAPVRGAYAYAWYIGASATNERFSKITLINSAVFTSIPTAPAQLASAVVAEDDSRNQLVFDGLLTIASAVGNNGYYVAMPTGTPGTGSGLTLSGSGGVQEIDTALQYFWDTYRLSPGKIWVNSQEKNYITRKVLTGAANSAQRFTFAANQNGLVGGVSIKGYLNPFTMTEGEEIPVQIHPNLPPGTMLFTTDVLPYPLSGVTNIAQVRARQDYYQIEWPRKSRKYEYGVYSDEVLQVYAPFAFGVITNIAPQ